MTTTGLRQNERGASLVIVIAMMLFGSLVIVALLGYAQAQLRSASVHRDRMAAVGEADDALDLALARIRADGALGREGSSLVTTLGDAEATCSGREGSGVADGADRMDRVVACSASTNGRELITITVRFLDSAGELPGADVQVLSRVVLS